MRFKQLFLHIYYWLKPSSLKKLNSLVREIKAFSDAGIEEWGCLCSDLKEWKRIFIGMTFYSCDVDIKKLWDGFANEKLVLKKLATTCSDFSVPVAICAINNDMVYLKTFLEYYRNLGVRHFVFIDNGFTDESVEYLEKHDDVSLFLAPFRFDGTKKAGWKLQALSYFGLNHWYIWLDSDEFLAYPQMEKIGLKEYSEILLSKGIVGVRRFMLDMYPNYELMTGQCSSESFYDEYVYYDSDIKYYKMTGGKLCGGMKARTLEIYNLRIDKTPLIFCQRNNIPMGNHFTFPVKLKTEMEYGCVLKHYKFLPNDADKYKKRALNSQSGFAVIDAQKKYVNLIGQQVFYEGSKKFTESPQLMEFPFMCDYMKNG